MNKLFSLLAVVLTLTILAFFGMAFAAKVSPLQETGSLAIALKPDIVITNMTIELIGVTPAAHKVRINVTVMDTVRGTSTGPFKIKVEWTEDPTGGFTLLGTSGVAKLVNSLASATVRGETRSFEHTVPMGKAYKYRATADFMNQVYEANEANNVTSAGYVAR
jgi:hypothetical protein